MRHGETRHGCTNDQVHEMKVLRRLLQLLLIEILQMLCSLTMYLSPLSSNEGECAFGVTMA